MKLELSKTKYDLEERTKAFSRLVRLFVPILPKTTAHSEDGKQLIRSSGSIGANYIEANEALSKKDFLFRIRICRKEAKETSYWLDLLSPNTEDLEKKRQQLLQESTELMKIFGAIIRKSESV